MLYHGGTVFGKACNNPSLLANTVLGIMINCMFGGPTFLTRMLPVAKLNAEFLAEQINETIISIKTAGGTINSLICDNNRTNQKFFKSFPTALNKPWVTTEGLFLLFDYVHIIKNIRNNWLTEKSGELIFDDNGAQKTAKWSHLVKLYQLESGSLVKLSKLNEVAIAPKPVERQSVASCLRVFSDETVAGLLTHPGMKDEVGVDSTTLFIKKVIIFWKIINVKSLGADARLNDQLRATISDPNDPRLDTLLECGAMCRKMISTTSKRVKQLTRDTSLAIHQTCNGHVELTRQIRSFRKVYY